MRDLSLLRPTPGALRVVGAVVAKDLRDAVRNRQIVSILVLVAVMIVFYRLLPQMTGGGDLPNLLIYDAGESQFVSDLQAASQFNLLLYPAPELLPLRLTELDTREIALVLPADFDDQLAAGRTPQLTAWVPYWLSLADATALADEVAGAVSESVGAPVSVTLDPERVYPPVDTFGPSFLVGLTLVFVAAMIGLSLVPTLMLDEKQARTLDVLLVSPATAGQIVAGKAVTGLVIVALFLLPCVWLYRAVVVHWWLVVAALFLVVLFCIGLGLLIGTAATQRQQVQMATLILAQPLLVPLFLMIMVDILPEWLVALTHWIPTGAAMVLIRAACTNPLLLADYGTAVVALAGGAVGVVAAAIWMVRRQDR